MAYYSKGNVNNVYTVNQQVDNLKEIMKENVNKVMDRDVSLRDLEDRTQNLEDHATLFKTSTSRVKRLFAWKSFKTTLYIVIGVLILLATIGLAIGLSLAKKS